MMWIKGLGWIRIGVKIVVWNLVWSKGLFVRCLGWNLGRGLDVVSRCGLEVGVWIKGFRLG